MALTLCQQAEVGERVGPLERPLAVGGVGTQLLRLQREGLTVVPLAVRERAGDHLDGAEPFERERVRAGPAGPWHTAATIAS